MNKCPKCGHEWPDESRAKGGYNKWAGMTPEQRSAEMSRVRKKGLKKPRKRKASARESNDLSAGTGDEAKYKAEVLPNIQGEASPPERAASKH